MRLPLSIAVSVALLAAGTAAFAAEGRDQWQQPDRVVQDLGLKAGSVVADVGSGAGYFTFRIASVVGDSGRVFAVDVDAKTLKALREAAERQRRGNIEVVESAPQDTRLKAESVDAAFLCNVLHDVKAADRLPLLQSTAKAMKWQASLFVIDLKKGNTLKFHKDEELIARDDLVKLAADAGLTLDAECYYLKHQTFLRFRKLPPAPAPAVKPVAMDVWPGKAPGEKGDIGQEQLQPPQNEPKPIARLTNVTRPTITVYRPPKENRTGAAVVICPGGGYHILAMDLEGEEVAAWLNSIGVTGIVLKYRVPARKDQPKHLAPLQDAQRAMSLVRSRAAEWELDPQRIGILGFSAGGHLAATASTNHDRRQYAPIDAIDQVSCRPDFTVLVYPAYLTAGSGLAPEVRVAANTPPTFFVHAGNDGISPENSISTYLALRRAKVPAELHVYATGGHGFGLRGSENACCTWPQRCAEWMKGQGLLKGR